MERDTYSIDVDSFQSMRVNIYEALGEMSKMTESEYPTFCEAAFTLILSSSTVLLYIAPLSWE